MNGKSASRISEGLQFFDNIITMSIWHELNFSTTIGVSIYESLAIYVGFYFH